MINRKTLILTGKDISTIMSYHGPDKIMDQLIANTDQAFKRFDPAKTKIPVRDGFNYVSPHQGLVEWMPLYQTDEQVMLKLVGYHPQNPARYGLPTIISTISKYDTRTGHLECIMDGTLPTALRTGAASAVASAYLAHPSSRSLGLVGCGAQAVTQLHAISRKFDLETVYYYDTDEQTLNDFEERCEMIKLNVNFKAASLEEVVQQSDILTTATSIEVGQGPLFEALDYRPHLHINAVGSDFPGKTELPLSLLEQSLVCPDFLDQALLEGECQQLDEKKIGPSIDEIIKQQKADEHVQSRYTVFDSTGWSLEDLVVMDLFTRHAKELSLGSEIEIESYPDNEKNPYQLLKAIDLVNS